MNSSDVPRYRNVRIDTNSKIPIYRNSLTSTYQIKNKNLLRWHVNYTEIDPAFDFQVCYVKFSSAQESIANHIHENSAEIVYVLRGEQFYNVDGKAYRVLGGEMLLSPPGLVHSSENVPEQKGDFYYITINPACVADVVLSSEPETVEKLKEMLQGQTAIYGFSDTNYLRNIMEELFQLHNSDCSHKKLRIRCALCELLLFTADAVESETVNETYTEFMDQVYLYIEDHVCEKLTVDDLAERFQYSKTAFRNKFKSYSQLPVHEYILRRKIEMAKRLLSDSAIDPHAVWEMLSFSSPSYFNQVFKRVTGMTVLQYLRNQQQL